MKPNLLQFRILYQDRNQINGLTRFHLIFPLGKETELGNLAAYLLEGKQFLSCEFSKTRQRMKENFAHRSRDWSAQGLCKEIA
jgi:hypothetical protein